MVFVFKDQGRKEDTHIIILKSWGFVLLLLCYFSSALKNIIKANPPARKGGGDI